MSQLPASAARALRAQSAKGATTRVVAAPGPVVVIPAPSAPPEPPATPAPPSAQKTVDLDVIGPRKLIRPTLPESMLRDRRTWHHHEPLLASHAAAAPHLPAHHDPSSHAESFYFQKQVQTQTLMVFVLEDGEKIEGCIEWYDRNAIKVRSSGSSLRSGRPDSPLRILIYKSSIKYLYKSGENSFQL
jgi:hypothetical protein